MNQSEYADVINLVKHAILSTDLALYFKRKNDFFKAANRGNFKGTGEGEKALLR